MKAILVIELNDDVKLDDVEIRYAIQDMYGMPVKAEVDGLKLKPMPKKQHAKWIWGDDDFQRGWNDCIDEILGDEK